MKWRSSHLVLILRCTTETSNGDDPFAKVKGLISDTIARLEEKASADDAHNANHKTFEAKQINLRAFDPKLVVYLSSHSWLEVMNIPFDLASNTISYRETLNPYKTSFHACSLQPTNGAAGEYAGSPGDQEVPGEHRTGPRNEVSARNEPRQRSDVAHRHEDQELSIPGCIT